MNISTSTLFPGLPAAAVAGVVLALAGAGCSTVAEPNRTLEGAHAGYRSLQGDPQAALLAPAEMSQADEALRTADAALSSRQKQETVDHLAYLAQQRVAIARETAGAKSAEKATLAAKAEMAQQKARLDRDEARSDAATARRSAQDTAVELAVAQVGAQQDKARSTELEAQLKALNAKQTDRGEVITLGDVLFEPNSNGLRADGANNLSRLTAFLQSHPGRTAVIEGFTDSDGSEAANLSLSERRASAVREALIQQGVVGERLTTRGYGEARPASSNRTAMGRQLNRRVEVVLSREDGSTPGR